MPMKEITLEDALGYAVERLPPLRKRLVERRLANKKYKATLLDELSLALMQCDDCPVQSVFGADDFDPVSTRFQIDLDNLERLLQIILEYLPKILELVLKFLPLFI